MYDFKSSSKIYVNKKGRNTTICNVQFFVFYHRDVSRYVQYWSHSNIYIVNHSTLHTFNRDCEGGRINPHYMKTFIRTARHLDTWHHQDSQASGHMAPSGQPCIWTHGTIRTARHLDTWHHQDSQASGHMAPSGQPGIWTHGTIRTARHMDSTAPSGQPGTRIAWHHQDSQAPG
jgi:hypothetical protein